MLGMFLERKLLFRHGQVGAGAHRVRRIAVLRTRHRHGVAPRSEIVDAYRYLGSLVADGSLSVPVEATYRLDDYRRALEHADAPKRGGKVLFAFDERQ